MYALCTSILAEVQSLSGPISPNIKVHLCDLKCTGVTLMFSKSGFLVKGLLLKSYFWVRSFKLYIFSVCHSHVVAIWKCSHILWNYEQQTFLMTKRPKNKTFFPVSVADAKSVKAIKPKNSQILQFFQRTTSKSRHFWPMAMMDVLLIFFEKIAILYSLIY